jgi:hypothetical protein
MMQSQYFSSMDFAKNEAAKGIQTDVSFEPNIAGSYDLGPVGGEFTVYFSDYCIFCELPLHTRFYE